MTSNCTWRFAANETNRLDSDECKKSSALPVLLREQPSREADDELSDFEADPSRLSGIDILRDLSEMTRCADRIDFILDQQEQAQLSRSHSRSVSPINRSRLRELALNPDFNNDDEEEADYQAEHNDEVD